jgi:UDP-N-acetylglucosamine acyltransferase
LNIVGLRRRGITRAQMHNLRRAYRSLFFVDGRLSDRIEAVARDFADDPLVGKIVTFARAGGKRPLMRPRVSAGTEASGDGGDAQEPR